MGNKPKTTNKEKLKNILREKDRDAFFLPYPTKTIFSGIEDEEEVILITRTHWISHIDTLLLAAGLLILPWILVSVMKGLSVTIILSIFILCILCSLSSLMYGFIKWYYNVNIITNKRVIDNDFLGIFTTEIAQARLEKIEDITSKQSGIISGIFNTGSVYIQTAGAKSEIEFDNIQNPQRVRDILNKLLDKKND